MDEEGQSADKVIQVLTRLISLSCNLIYFFGKGKFTAFIWYQIYIVLSLPRHKNFDRYF